MYTGYKKCHGIKVETVLLPNGISTVFGPVSARRQDAGVEALSNLNQFLIWLQRGLFWFAASGDWIFYSVFGDSAFGL